MEIAEALKNILENIKCSAVKADRDLDKIKLITVSKTIELQRVIEAVNAGATILGESRVQEARSKIEGFNGEVEWHLIGNLQKNKARTAVELFDLIHSVDSAELAAELNKHAKNAGIVQDILVQVKLSEEYTKHGADEKDLMVLLNAVAGMENLRLQGLMTIPPFFDDPEEARPYFRKLRKIAERASAQGFTMNELSMGMSNDYEVAIEEGATMVRVGTAIFGARKYKI
ncbi:MAG TPA: YggS family pyridoxal phosphate-dependent enzyme [Nitrospirae bacterium]|nr:YggS family pyridoxal phosphate-dependent enzyme [Nitrospirota bacterium]HDZ84731.1 YggS family pyridoxal phosphate-dependent enzyme [Nitrospirota bacterium]